MQKIMIDGVNVAECKHLDEWKHCDICIELIKTIEGRSQCIVEADLRCSFYSNCYFKQLQRLKAKNEKLRKLIADYKQALKEIKNISDDYNLTVSKRREQIADIVNSLLEQE